MSAEPVKALAIELQQHPLSAVFPPMSANDLADLIGDIRETTLRNPIMLYEGMVLDGWHRYLACIGAGTRPDFINYTGSDPVAYVKSQNWHRRHLSQSQRAAAEVALSEWEGAGNPGNVAAAATPPKTNAQMASAAGVSPRLIRDAKAVHANAAPEVQAAVRDGVVSLERAAQIAKLPKREQPKAMRQPPEPKPKPKPANDDIEQRCAVLEAKNKELREKLEDLADDLATFSTLSEGEAAIAKEMNILRGKARDAERRRNELMREKGEMQRQIAHWRRLAEKGAK